MTVLSRALLDIVWRWPDSDMRDIIRRKKALVF